MPALEVGFAREDITAHVPGIAMLGWGMLYNRVEGVAEPLHARAMVVRDPASGGRVAYVCADLLLISQGVRTAVLDQLERDHAELDLGPASVMLTATHTHSAPAGYSHHFWVNLAGPGYSDPVFRTVVDGIVRAIAGAARTARPGALSFHQGEVPPSAGIAFNRSWFAYSRNEGVDPVDYDGRSEAVDATISMLRFDPEDGSRAGMVSWFPLHGTCVHSENRLIHPDHKGLASEGFSASADAPFGIFAQEATGDVSPNHRYDKARGKVVGRFEDDHETAAWVASVEVDHARRVYDEAPERGAEVAGPVAAAVCHVDFGRAPIDARFAERPDPPATTRPATIGLSMARGTAEGPGPLGKVPWVAHAMNGMALAFDAVMSRLVPGRERTHDNMFPLIDVGRGLDGGRLLGLLPLRSVPALDPVLRFARQIVQSGALDGLEWLPQVLPLQLFRIGPVAIAASPFELTTVAGRRLRSTLLEALAPSGVRHVVLNPYANAYAGYLTTFEEYRCQHYEAGYTVFGPFQLAAVRGAFHELAGDLEPTGRASGSPPERMPEASVQGQAFEYPWPHYYSGKKRRPGPAA